MARKRSHADRPDLARRLPGLGVGDLSGLWCEPGRISGVSPLPLINRFLAPRSAQG